MTTGAVILAAGEGRRFDGSSHKLLARWHGRPLFNSAIDTARAAGVGPVLVVTGAARLRLPIGVIEVYNASWRDGQATSLAAAVAVARANGWSAIIVGLADQPGIDPAAWRAVAASTAPIACANYDGARRNPVRLDHVVWGLLPTTGDEAARAVMRMRPDLVEDVTCSGQPADIDTVEDLARWSS
jgi:molybdenum cofactor cytidylyltransferase